MLPEQQQRILGYFIEEARDHLNTIEQGLLNLQSTLNDPEMINEVFRAAHSIKGGAAMLGLTSIQHTSHRLEDYFKILKDHPVQIDQKLESLFLGVSDTLKALLEHLTGPFGLTEDAVDTLMSETEPVFQWLHEHLEMLVEQSGGAVTSYTELAAVTTSSHIFQPQEISTTQPHLASETKSVGEFQSQVLQKLREMLQLFKQSPTLEIRQQLQDCCYELARFGESLNFSNWCGLCRSTGSAIANQENSFLSLAKTVITEIKQALELATQNRDGEIAISPQLEALLSVLQIELLEITDDFLDESSTDINLTLSASTLSTANLDIAASTENNFADAVNLQLFELEPQDTIRSLSELSTPRKFDSENSISSLDETLLNFNSEDSIRSLSELYTSANQDQDNFADIFSGDRNDSEEDRLLNNISIDLNAPEVGIAELNALADFFEGETPDLDETWQKVEILDNTPDSKLEINISKDTEDAENDFADLLSLEKEVRSAHRQTKPTATEDFTLFHLFDDNLPEQASAFKDISITNLELSENSLSDEILPELASSSDDIAFSNETQEDILSILFALTADDNELFSIREVTQPKADNINVTFTSATTSSLNELEETILSTIKSESDEFFDSLNLPITVDFSQSEDELNDFWSQESEEEQNHELSPEVEQDTVRALEASLFAAAASGDIFGSTEQASEESFNIEDVDITFLQEDLIFTSDVGDDLFAQLTSTDSAALFSDRESPQESQNIPQQHNSHFDPEQLSTPMLPEAVDVVPEFTTSEAYLKSFTEEKVDLLDNDLFTGENFLIKPNQEEFVPETAIEETRPQASEAVLEIADDEDLLEIPEYQDTFSQPTSEVEIIENESAALEYITAQTQQIEDVDTANLAFVDEFADLEALLNDEVISTPDISISDMHFADLDALLDGEKLPSSVAPIAINNVSSKAVSSELADEFGDLEKLLKEADQTISHSSTPTSSTGKNQRPLRRGTRFEETMRVSVKHLDDMSNLVGELVVNRNTLEEDQERQRQSLENLLHQVQQLSDVGARMQELYERSLLEASLLASRKHKIVSDSNTDRGLSELEMDRFTPFHTLSQEMIELIVRVRESASDIDFITDETDRVARQFRQVTTQLQEGLTKARMEPFSQATDGLQRGVRDTAIKYGRQVELVIEGGDTFIDKMIVEHLKTPLNHMLNNAIAHGIETPEVRQGYGKSPVGIITVRAFHQGNQTIISVKDDGAGINTDQVKTKAIAKGLITLEKAKSMSPIEVYDLLFEPNFSTKDEADELSGRGVGMDVVRTSISEIRGTITTDSTVGKGTTFTIRLPLTLSICKALCCVSDKARIAFPMDGVEDTLDIPAKNIQTNADGQSFISWRDTMLPFRPLKELLTFNRLLSRGNVYGGNRDDDMISVIVVRSANTLIALQIDQVLSEQEIVIKQFERPAPKPIGVAGATVLGDGRIMPIADVLEIIDIFQGRTAKQSNVSLWEQKNTTTPPETVTKIDPTVLIVDDSITVRELLSLTFNKAGYRVEQARDGQEAWDKLRSGLPCDIVFCDIEMPRCDGLELLSRIQKDSTLNHLPIAMLTSRGADKHRQMAVQLGASGYFTKPYLEEALLEAAGRMLKGEKLINSNSNA
jgi:chemotaxis protein histidine kinase CheA/ActR/RegA family two-component response regulator